jgi:hypothetical protein
MPTKYVPAQSIENGLGLTDKAADPVYAQCDEDNNLYITIPKPFDWDGDPMTLKIFGGASGQVTTGAKITVRSGLGGYDEVITCDNPDDAAISLDIEEAWKILDTVSIIPIGSGDLLRIRIEYFSETYGATLYILGAELSYASI